MIWSSTSLQTQVRFTIMPYSSQQLLQMQACWNIKNFSGGCVFFGMMKCMYVYPQYGYFMSLHKTSETVLRAMCSQQFWHLYVSNFLFLYFIATSCSIFLSPEIQQLDRTIGYVLDVSGNLDTSLGLFINPHSPKVVRSTAKSTKIQRMATAVDIKYESALGVWSQNNHVRVSESECWWEPGAMVEKLQSLQRWEAGLQGDGSISLCIRWVLQCMQGALFHYLLWQVASHRKSKVPARTGCAASQRRE